MNLSDKIFHLRKAINLFQEELAEKLGVSRQAISKWELGETIPETEKIAAIADAFNVTTDYLLRQDILDKLSIKTTLLEQQQIKILGNQDKQKRKQFLVISIVITTLAFIMLFFVGKILADFTTYANLIMIIAVVAVIIKVIVLNYGYNLKLNKERDKFKQD